MLKRLALISVFLLMFSSCMPESKHEDADYFKNGSCVAFYPLNNDEIKSYAESLCADAGKRTKIDYEIEEVGDFWKIIYPEKFFYTEKYYEKLNLELRDHVDILSNYLRYEMKKDDLDVAYTSKFMLETKEKEGYINKILFNTRRLSTLVGNILLLSKIDNQAISAKQSLFRLDEQIRQVILLQESEWGKKDIEFDVELDEIEYKGNENLLFHVWNNLLSNAVKFSPSGGLITMKLFRQEKQLIFMIEDEGCGVSEDARKHIFDKFYQADNSHKEEGNGLGLALVKQILLVTNGEIIVENRTEGGCRFQVFLQELD